MYLNEIIYTFFHCVDNNEFLYNIINKLNCFNNKIIFKFNLYPFVNLQIRSLYYDTPDITLSIQNILRGKKKLIIF